MKHFLRIDALLSECLSLDSLRRILQKNQLSIIGDFEEKIERLASAILREDIRFREDFLHLLCADEVREMAYQLGFETDCPVWKIKEDLNYWFNQVFENLSSWTSHEELNFDSKAEVLSWIATGSFSQVKEILKMIEEHYNNSGILAEFCEVETKEAALIRLAGMAPHILIETASEVLQLENEFYQDEEVVDLDSAYEVLGLRPNHAGSEIKRRYYELMKNWHPDRLGHELTAKDLKYLHNIQNAFQLIKEKRSDIR